MNASLNSLKLALRLAVEDADNTAYDVTSVIRDTLKELSSSHLVRSNKAGSITVGLTSPSVAPSPYDDTMPSFGGVSSDTISLGVSQTVSPYFGASGVDHISFT